MTFQDRKQPGKDWDKIKEKREEIHHGDEEKANQPKSIFAQVDDELRRRASEKK